MPGNKRSRVGTQPDHRFGQFFRPSHAPDGLGREIELLALWQFCDDLFDQWGAEDAWADGVDADILLREFERGGLGQADDRYRTLFLVFE